MITSRKKFKSAKEAFGPSQPLCRTWRSRRGNFAKAVLLPGFKAHQLVALQGICTAKGISAKAAHDRFGFQYCAEDADELIADRAVNSVLIATRHNLHGPLVDEALAAGKHVFVEKPLCLDADELNLIIRRYAGSIDDGKAPS